MEILSEVLGWLFPNSEMMVVYLLSLAGGVIILSGGYLLSIRSSRAIAVEREREKFERLVQLLDEYGEKPPNDSSVNFSELYKFKASKDTEPLDWKKIQEEYEKSGRSIGQLNKIMEDQLKTVIVYDVCDALNSPARPGVKVSWDPLAERPTVTKVLLNPRTSLVWGQDVHVTPVEEQRAGDTLQDSPAQEQPPRPRAPDRP